MSYPLSRFPFIGSKGRTSALWRGTLEKYGQDPNLVRTFLADFDSPKTLAFTTTALTAGHSWIVGEAGATGAASGSFSSTSNSEGTMLLTAATNTDWEGAQVQAGEATAQGESIVLPTHSTGPKGEVVFEASVALLDSTNDTFFVGFAEPGMSATALLSATGVLTDAADYIGFYRLDSGDLQFVVRNDNSGGTAVEYNVDVVADADLPDNTWVKLGFRISETNKVEIWVDGAEVTRTSDTNAKINVPSTALPIEYLTRKAVVLRGAAGDNDPASLNFRMFDAAVSER